MVPTPWLNGGPITLANDRLTLDLLETYLCWPTVERMTFGPGDWLVVENYTTYHSLGRRAGELGFNGQVIWGSGNGVSTRLAALAAEQQTSSFIYYFGDVDVGGLRIARLACGRASALGLPKLVAAGGLYELTLRHGKPMQDNNSRNPDPTLFDWMHEWLKAPLGAEIAGVLTDRKRIVQETVGRELLANTELTQWFHHQ